jgi:hypothetical protein
MVICEYGVGLDMRCRCEMNRVERPQPCRRKPSCMPKNEIADAHEEARVQETQGLDVNALVRIRKAHRARHFHEGDPTRRENVTFRSEIAVEARTLPLFDDELDERRGVRVEERRFSAQRGRPLAPRRPSAR